jgi:hypothetical protein
MWANALREAEKVQKIANIFAIACEDYPERQDLVEAYHRFNQQETLAALIGRVALPWPVLLRLGAECLAQGAQLPVAGSDAPGLVDFLWDIRAQREQAPLPIFVFAAKVAAATADAKLRQELQEWIKTTAGLLALEDQIASLAEEAATVTGETAARAYFSIEIGANPAVQDKKYSLIIRLWTGDASYTTLFCDYTEGLSLETIEQQWNTVFTDPETVRRLPGKPKDIQLEFVVPHDLLSHPFDRWKIPNRYFGETYGMIYPVVVRSWERTRLSFTDRERHNLWCERAEKALRGAYTFDGEEATAAKCDCDAQRCLRSGQTPEGEGFSEWLCEPHQLAPKAHHRRWRAAKQLVCLKLTYQPTTDFTKSDSVVPWIDAGVPVAVWRRQCATLPLSPAELRAKVVDLVGRETALKELPQRFREIREAADDEETALGAHLTLFWDDARRRPDLEDAMPAFIMP